VFVAPCHFVWTCVVHYRWPARRLLEWNWAVRYRCNWATSTLILNLCRGVGSLCGQLFFVSTDKGAVSFLSSSSTMSESEPCKLFTPRERRLNREAMNERCLRKLNPEILDFQRIGHTAVFRYTDFARDGSDDPRWLNKRMEGQLFVMKSAARESNVRFNAVCIQW